MLLISNESKNVFVCYTLSEGPFSRSFTLEWVWGSASRYVTYIHYQHFYSL